MNTFQFFMYNCSLTWKMQRNELPLKVFISTFAIRIIFQALFFVWVVGVIGGDRMKEFALYGNMLIPAVHILLIDIYNILKDEIDEQRLDLLTITKSSLLSILIGRSIVYFLKSVLIIIFTYIVISSLLIDGFGHWYYFLTALPLIIIFALSAYALGIFIASINVNQKISEMLPNIMLSLLILMGNFTIPIENLPTFLQVVSHFLPLGHIVSAFRSYMVEGIPYWTNPTFYLEIPIMLIYLLFGYGLYLYSVKRMRKAQ
ncbi:ABC transporter permease [Bacillus salitolerans]|uniref:ABC transporter permease n=1 Tax=Bacillus salitolerans TaxID=1437434 RepID=A0ABW4LQ59_9BACI